MESSGVFRSGIGDLRKRVALPLAQRPNAVHSDHAHVHGVHTVGRKKRLPQSANGFCLSGRCRLQPAGDDDSHLQQLRGTWRRHSVLSGLAGFISPDCGREKPRSRCDSCVRCAHSLVGRLPYLSAADSQGHGPNPCLVFVRRAFELHCWEPAFHLFAQAHRLLNFRPPAGFRQHYPGKPRCPVGSARDRRAVYLHRDPLLLEPFAYYSDSSCAGRAFHRRLFHPAYPYRRYRDGAARRAGDRTVPRLRRTSVGVPTILSSADWMELRGLRARILIVKLFLASGEAHMRRIIKAVFFAVFLLTSAIVSLGQSPASKDARGLLVVVFKDGHSQSFPLAGIVGIDLSAPARIVFRDGHQQSLALNDTSRIEFGSSAVGGSLMGKNHFLGKWKVGVGGGGGHFFITLKDDGEATKTIGANHGTWTVVDG